jgi:CTP synthase
VNPIQLKNIRENRYGGTMRLGAYDCELKPGTLASRAYATLTPSKPSTPLKPLMPSTPFTISERHRHRYEFNNAYRAAIEKNGLIVSGVNPQSGLVEIVELKDHPFFVGVQFHPEFHSRPLRPHPLFKAFIKAALKR